MDSDTPLPSLPSALSSSLPLSGERVAFTGTLASMTHAQAHALVEQYGGTATVGVSRQTTLLVVGEEGWPLEPDGKPSQKLQQVTAWQQQGVEIRVLPESEWLHLLGLDERRRDVHRVYTPAMLSQLLGVPVSIIRGWERAGLIRAVRKVYRLPYFDYQEVANVRRLSELLAAGVPRKELEQSLRSLHEWLGGEDRPLAQLDILARDARIVCRDHAGLLEPRSGQRLFDFDGPAESPHALQAGGTSADASLGLLPPFPLRVPQAPAAPDEWFRRGCQFAAEDELASAIEAFRLCLMERPGDAETHLHLAECLLRQGELRAALERYYAAVESDHEYLEAWTQLGCLHAELGEPEAALDALRIALRLHPDYPDAHWHLADVLWSLGRQPESEVHWQAYLQHDQRGPWAETARQRLAELGRET